MKFALRTVRPERFSVDSSLKAVRMANFVWWTSKDPFFLQWACALDHISRLELFHLSQPWGRELALPVLSSVAFELLLICDGFAAFFLRIFQLHIFWSLRCVSAGSTVLWASASSDCRYSRERPYELGLCWWFFESNFSGSNGYSLINYKCLSVWSGQHLNTSLGARTTSLR